MAIMILDEEFYKENVYFSEKDYLNDLLDFVSKYVDAEIAIFAPNANISSAWSQNYHIAYVNQEIQKRGNFLIFDQLETIAERDVDFLECSESFIGELHYLHNTGNDVIILFPLCKHDKNIKQMSTYAFIINHITKELNSNFSHWVSNGINIKNTITPTQESPLPNTELTKHYKDVLEDKLKGLNHFERIPAILDVTGEVLRRNGYTRDAYISAINSTKKKIRDVYRNDDSLTIFGSIDVDSGSVEICYHDGKHNDEYGYDNKKHDKHDDSGGHDIKLHK